MYCNNCGNILEDGHRFCTRCGAARPEIIPGPKGSRWVPAFIAVLFGTLGCIMYFITTS